MVLGIAGPFHAEQSAPNAPHNASPTPSGSNLAMRIGKITYPGKMRRAIQSTRVDKTYIGKRSCISSTSIYKKNH